MANSAKLHAAFEIDLHTPMGQKLSYIAETILHVLLKVINNMKNNCRCLK